MGKGGEVEKRKGPSSFLPLPFLYLPSFTHFLPIPLDVGPLKPAGSAVSFPSSAKNELGGLCRAVRKPQVAIILSILKCMFYIMWSEKLD